MDSEQPQTFTTNSNDQKMLPKKFHKFWHCNFIFKIQTILPRAHLNPLIFGNQPKNPETNFPRELLILYIQQILSHDFWNFLQILAPFQISQLIEKTKLRTISGPNSLSRPNQPQRRWPQAHHNHRQNTSMLTSSNVFMLEPSTRPRWPRRRRPHLQCSHKIIRDQHGLESQRWSCPRLCSAAAWHCSDHPGMQLLQASRPRWGEQLGERGHQTGMLAVMNMGNSNWWQRRIAITVMDTGFTTYTQ